MGDAIGQIFQNIVNALSPIVIPDWTALIGMLPVLLVIGVVGPLVSLLALGWVIYFLGKPRSRLPYVEPQPVPARIVDGRPQYPAGEPYCAFDGLIYPFGATRCETCGRDLAVICPKCGTGRAAFVDTCGTCGLVLKIKHDVAAVRTAAGPPPGGAAAA